MRWFLSLAVWAGIVAGFARKTPRTDVYEQWKADRDALRRAREAGL